MEIDKGRIMIDMMAGNYVETKEYKFFDRMSHDTYIWFNNMVTVVERNIGAIRSIKYIGTVDKLFYTTNLMYQLDLCTIDVDRNLLRSEKSHVRFCDKLPIKAYGWDEFKTFIDRKEVNRLFIDKNGIVFDKNTARIMQLNSGI